MVKVKLLLCFYPSLHSVITPVYIINHHPATASIQHKIVSLSHQHPYKLINLDHVTIGVISAGVFLSSSVRSLPDPPRTSSSVLSIHGRMPGFFQSYCSARFDKTRIRNERSEQNYRFHYVRHRNRPDPLGYKPEYANIVPKPHPRLSPVDTASTWQVAQSLLSPQHHKYRHHHAPVRRLRLDPRLRFHYTEVLAPPSSSSRIPSRQGEEAYPELRTAASNEWGHQAALSPSLRWRWFW